MVERHRGVKSKVLIAKSSKEQVGYEGHRTPVWRPHFPDPEKASGAAFSAAKNSIWRGQKGFKRGDQKIFRPPEPLYECAHEVGWRLKNFRPGRALEGPVRLAAGCWWRPVHCRLLRNAVVRQTETLRPRK